MTSVEDNQCAICLELLSDSNNELLIDWTCDNCGNKLHKVCINDWGRGCPYCRVSITYPIIPNNSPVNIVRRRPPSTPRSFRIEYFYRERFANIIGFCMCTCIIMLCIGCVYLILNPRFFNHGNYNRTIRMEP